MRELSSTCLTDVSIARMFLSYMQIKCACRLELRPTLVAAEAPRRIVRKHVPQQVRRKRRSVCANRATLHISFPFSCGLQATIGLAVRSARRMNCCSQHSLERYRATRTTRPDLVHPNSNLTTGSRQCTPSTAWQTRYAYTRTSSTDGLHTYMWARCLFPIAARFG